MKIDIQNLKVTPEEFLEYTGINLAVELRGTDHRAGNPSNAVEAWLERNRIRVNTWIEQHYTGGLGFGFREPTDYEKYHYKLALLEQDYYVFKNGDIASDSGRDDNGAMRMSRDDIKELSLALETIRHLNLAGLYRRSIGSWGFFSAWWLL